MINQPNLYGVCTNGGDGTCFPLFTPRDKCENCEIFKTIKQRFKEISETEEPNVCKNQTKAPG